MNCQAGVCVGVWRSVARANNRRNRARAALGSSIRAAPVPTHPCACAPRRHRARRDPAPPSMPVRPCLGAWSQHTRAPWPRPRAVRRAGQAPRHRLLPDRKRPVHHPVRLRQLGRAHGPCRRAHDATTARRPRARASAPASLARRGGCQVHGRHAGVLPRRQAVRVHAQPCAHRARPPSAAADPGTHVRARTRACLFRLHRLVPTVGQHPGRGGEEARRQARQLCRLRV